MPRTVRPALPVPTTGCAARRASWAWAILLALPFVAAAASTNASAQVSETECPDVASAVDQRGLQLFTDHCLRCHKAADLAARIQGAPDPDAAAGSMLAFLARHGSCDTAGDEAILRYLSTLQP